MTFEQDNSICPHCLSPITLCGGCWYQDLLFPKITQGQRRVFDAIAGYYQTHGYSASMREIGDMLSIRSTNAIAEHIQALLTKGYLRGSSKIARSWVPVFPPKNQPHLKLVLAEIAEEWEAIGLSYLEQKDDPAQHAAGMVAYEMARTILEQIQPNPPDENPSKKPDP